MKDSYLFCPFTYHCQIYNLKRNGLDEKELIKFKEKYSCSVIESQNKDNQHNQTECVLIKLLNQTKK